jgi:hypothetical protein
MPAFTRSQKITFAEMREMDVRGILVYCADYHCSHSLCDQQGQWPNDLGLRISSSVSCGRVRQQARPAGVP